MRDLLLPKGNDWIPSVNCGNKMVARRGVSNENGAGLLVIHIN